MSEPERTNASSSSDGSYTNETRDDKRSMSPEKFNERSKEQDGEHENGNDEEPEDGRETQRHGPPSSRHIQFRSQGNLVQEAQREPPREDPRSEWEMSQKLVIPHRPSMPYSHESADIADTPPQGRGQGDQEGEAAKEKQPEEQPPEQEPSKETGREISSLEHLKRRIRSTTDRFKQKASEIGERLGRPTTGGDDLHPGVYHADWASGSQPPVSDVTDNMHKTDEQKRQHQAQSSSEAHRLVRDLTQGHSGKRRKTRPKPYPHGGSNYIGGEDESALDSGLRYRSGGGGILSQLIKLNGGNQQGGGGGMPSRTPSQSSLSAPASRSDSESGRTTPGKKAKPPKWYKRPPNTSTSTLVGVSGNLSGASTPVSSEVLSAASQRRGVQAERKMNLEDEIRVTVHIAEIICRQRYIMQLCRALMLFGAPTHRLEEYMQMTAKVLEVDSQFLYLPGCMIMSFDDPSTRTTEVKLVRVGQGVDLARLADTHLIYKNVIHDVIGIEEAVQELDDVVKKKPRYPKWMVVLVYGLATATVGPFAFNARPIDMPIIFINGLLVGLMQHVAAPRSVLYSNVFEVTSTVVTSFLARAFGSIPRAIIDGKRQYLFCFSAISQSSIALILPGFLVLCSSLELQSHQIIAGSIRMVYAIIFSLFLGYGITVGTTIYGLMDNEAVSDIQCPQLGAFKNPYVQRFPFVTIMTVWLLIINQGKWKQLPPMTIIALSGYISNYFSTKKLGSNSQVANTVGAFTVGIMGNLYSRLWHGHAATAILPGIFILVPSGLAATGSLISGVQSADQIRQNVTSHGSASSAPGAGLQSSSSVFSLGFGMIQVAIGITIGLFIAALCVYPYGKRRSGLFSF
ncbi:Putative Domain membrane protein [Penicillium brasilianum]|uniref:Putative Domain membrane protein n=1 Tax=Penicillium brasilianum TaxID=104259 RepID=A0A0F7TY06_PENBI|nr:Putative Domain membrane protein [Penicillium brasilianum]